MYYSTWVNTQEWNNWIVRQIHCLTFFKNCQTVFQSTCITLHFHQQCMRFLIPPDPHLVLSVLLMLAILIDMYPYLIVCLVYISLMTNDEHIFTCLLPSISSQMKNLFKSFACYFIELFVLLLLSFDSTIQSFYVSLYQIDDLQILFLHCGLYFHSLNSAFLRKKREVLNFVKVQFTNFFYIDCAACIVSKKIFPN